jgi:hypothetical protein
MFFNKKPNEYLLDGIKNNKYSPAHITSVFLRYRNNPEEALQHLDDDCTKIFLPQREIYDINIIEKENKHKNVMNDNMLYNNMMNNNMLYNNMINNNMMNDNMMNDNMMNDNMMNDNIINDNIKMTDYNQFQKMQGEIPNFNMMFSQTLNNPPKVI